MVRPATATILPVPRWRPQSPGGAADGEGQVIARDDTESAAPLVLSVAPSCRHKLCCRGDARHGQALGCDGASTDRSEGHAVVVAATAVIDRPARREGLARAHTLLLNVCANSRCHHWPPCLW